MVKMSRAITQMTLLGLDLSSDEEVDWNAPVDELSENDEEGAVSPMLEHVGVSPPSDSRDESSGDSSRDSARDSAQQEAGASGLDEVEPKSHTMSAAATLGKRTRDEESARTEANPAEYEARFGVCAPDAFTVRNEVWKTMVRTSTKMDENGAFKAVVKAGLGPSMQSNSMVDPMIDGMMCHLLKVDKIDIDSLWRVVGEIPDFMRHGIEAGDFPSTSTAELIAQVQNLSDLLQQLCEACTAAYLQMPPDDYKHSASECIKECLRMLKLLSGFRVHDGMSWQSEELSAFVSFVSTISKRNINVLARMTLPEQSEFLKLALVEYLKEDLFKKLGTEVASLTKWADNKIKKVDKAAEKAAAAEKKKTDAMAGRRMRDDIDPGSPDQASSAALKAFM
tara:strand:- start:2647 stop:3828 length:1182 start_codon:yes stop_codon:yes gene_type:complete